MAGYRSVITVDGLEAKIKKAIKNQSEKRRINRVSCVAINFDVPVDLFVPELDQNFANLEVGKDTVKIDTFCPNVHIYTVGKNSD